MNVDIETRVSEKNRNELSGGNRRPTEKNLLVDIVNYASRCD